MILAPDVSDGWNGSLEIILGLIKDRLNFVRVAL